MQKFINAISVILIIIGIVLLSYTGITYQTQEKVAQIGDVKITAETDKTIPFSPVAGGLCLAIGIGLLVFNRMKR